MPLPLCTCSLMRTVQSMISRSITDVTTLAWAEQVYSPNVMLGMYATAAKAGMMAYRDRSAAMLG